MKLTPLCIAIATLAASIASAHAADIASTTRQAYLVQLTDAPVAAYAGGVAGLAATKPAAGKQLSQSLASSQVQSYASYLSSKQNAIQALVASAPVLYRYQLVFNGFAAMLTPDEAKRLQGTAGVAAVTRSKLRTLNTDTTPAFLGLDQPGGLWSQLGGAQHAGEDVIVGIIDSGISPENPAFADRLDADGQPSFSAEAKLAYGPAPAGWKGSCTAAPGFTAANCNNKLIGAKFFDSYITGGTNKLAASDFHSPRDGHGHGSHTASTAAGNHNVATTRGGAAVKLSGMAPRARIAAYKACWVDGASAGCDDSDTVAAVEAAVRDGVHVINFSIDGGADPLNDPTEQAFLQAANAGVFIAAAAGNSGPANTVVHVGPWVTTVAAANAGQGRGQNVPVIADFSSRGPNLADRNVLKPDLAAPGVNIFAAGAASLSKEQHAAVADGSAAAPAAWVTMSGTSMAAPHVAGLAALLRQQHPGWSPAAIKSALMTSASATLPDQQKGDERGQLAFGQGAGFVTPNLAADPGLVYDLGAADYQRYQCGLGKTTACATGTLDSYNLNLPSITIDKLYVSQTVRRSVTNVGTQAAIYTASASLDGFNVTVTPATLSLAPGETKPFSVTIKRSTAPGQLWQYGALEWTDGTHRVRSPLTVKPVLVDTPRSIEGSGASGSRLLSVRTAIDGQMNTRSIGFTEEKWQDLRASIFPEAYSWITEFGCGIANWSSDQSGDNWQKFSVPENTRMWRLATTTANNPAGVDVDLKLYDSSGVLVAQSRGPTADEAIALLNPPAGNYTLCVIGNGVSSASTLAYSSAMLRDGPGVGKLVAGVPGRSYSPGTATLGVSWSGLEAGKTYLGMIEWQEADGTPAASTFLTVKPKAAAQ